MGGLGKVQHLYERERERSVSKLSVVIELPKAPSPISSGGSVCLSLLLHWARSVAATSSPIGGLLQYSVLCECEAPKRV
uniref:Uncharacterized protein n=1 Tax=Nelumbo nucifera TaxID=4432 RepID=A0A822YH30_NELNU|nr:TPA_asm: hypothetical protein HUJ06_010751 [Nelumbo nucifera]